MFVLDVRTVIFSHLVTDILCAAVLLTLWLQNRKRFAGTSFWVADLACQTAAILLIVLRGSIPDWLSIGFSSLLTLGGVYLGYLGLERFVKKQSAQLYNAIILAAFTLIHLYFTFIHPDLAARNLNVSAGLLIFCSQCAWLMLKRVEAGERRRTRDVGFVFSLFSLVSLIRIFVILAIPPQSNDFFRTGQYDTLILLSFQLLIILFTFSLALLVSYSLAEETRAEEEKFTAAFRCAPYAILLTHAADGLIFEVNEGFVQLTGYAYAEALGKTTHELHLWAREEDRAGVIADLSQGSTVKGREYEFRKKSGELLTGLFSAETITIDDQPALLSSINDITERKQAQEQINLLAKFPSENPHPVLRINHDGIMLYANPASQALLVAYGAAVGKPAPEAWREIVFEALSSHTNLTTEITHAGLVYSFFVVPVVEAQYVNLYGADITEQKRAAGILQASEQRYRSLFENMLNGYAYCRMLYEDSLPADFIYLAVNPAFEKLTGLKDVVGRKVSEIIPGIQQSDADLFEIFGRVAQSGQSETFENYIPSLKMWFSITVYSPQKEYFVAVFDVITERKQAEEKLRALSLRHQALLVAVPEIIMEVDNDKIYRWANPAGIEFFGADVLGKEAAAYFEGEQATYQMVQPLFNGDENTIYVESWQRRKDGQKRLLAWRCRALKDSAGRVTGVLSSARDITDSQRIEEALRESEEKYRLISESATDLLYWITPDGNIRYISPSCERVTGYTSAEIIDHPNLLTEIIHPDDRESYVKHLEKAHDEDETHELEFRITTKSNELRWIHHTCRSIYTPKGINVGQRVTNRNITERKRAEENLEAVMEELKRSNAELEQFAYVASHDLQEPLRAVAGMVQLLQQHYQGKLDERANEYIDLTVEAAGRMQALINDLLAYSRVHRLGNPFEAVNAAVPLNAALANLNVAIQESQAAITHDPLPTVIADATQLTQLFQNLIGNAIKFRSQRTPQIHIGVQDLGNAWRFEVRDNGIGIEPQYYERIFLVFQRLHTRREYPGTGIGLAICKKIVERHGGKIWVASENGQGSMFYFTMPKRR